ncbi:MAG TPA: urease accessory protein UreD [Usitatibacter sp.]|jgi:urease accessory protein|nr:urease accessory protein UreD [Usitatibacter sp.]
MACAPSLPYDAAPAAAAPAAGWRARLELGFERRAGRTVLAHRRHDGPLAVQKVLHPEDPSVCHAIVLHPPGGIAGGDDLHIELRANDGAHVLATTPGATKWYRSPGSGAFQRVVLDVAAGASLEWLPQESIVFDGALADASLELRLAPGARAIAWDITCLGRRASGEAFTRGRFRTHARLSHDGRLAWRERGEIDPADGWLRAAAGLGDAHVVGTMMVAAREIPDAWMTVARAIVPGTGDAACTRLPGVLLARYRGASGEAARACFTSLWSALREPVLGRVAVEPRIWRT